ncbi:hypothetical protein H8959_009672 [Pygathrix nigripes]
MEHLYLLPKSAQLSREEQFAIDLSWESQISTDDPPPGVPWQHESSMTGRPQEKPPEPGPQLSHLRRSRCEHRLFTTVLCGPYLSQGEDVKPPALHMSGTGQQEHLAPATFTDMSAVE